ncbi:hypothetical protein MA16_Dca010659 [Dendrobium catenatum]|uniref:Uncharacterized protein n=1 Tax=Dendrobium catenatum TaxID=906689 RepID=A0A2I0VZS8_9ASPA|nr:hypothetical protein MA16_Dca010659 [Dendrobium catenatum]
MKTLLVHQGAFEAISREDMAAVTNMARARKTQLKAHSAILLSLSDEVLRVTEEGFFHRSLEEIGIIIFEEIVGHPIISKESSIYYAYG